MKYFLLFFVFVAVAAGYIQFRILGGKPVKSGEFPYQARLWLTKPYKGNLADKLCGGSLISNKVVLTAAHCLQDVIYGIVLLGATDLKKNEPTQISIKVKPENFILHEDWQQKNWRNDIALIILPESVKLNDAVKVVNLPHANQIDLVDRIGVISGFGLIGNAPVPSNELLFAERRILAPRYCEHAYPNGFQSYHLCVDGSFGKSACSGDSGGPLVISEADGIKTLVGLTSFGSASCEMGYPTIYIRIASFLEWIHKHTGIPIKM